MIPMIEDVQTAACEYFGLRLGQLLGDDRHREVSRPRHMAMYLARESGRSFGDISHKFGKNSNTVQYAVSSIRSLMGADIEVAHDINEIRLIIREKCHDREIRLGIAA